MPADAASVFVALGLGVGATLLVDAWNLLLKRMTGVRSLNYCLLGRWVLHMPSVFHHASIASAARKPGECAVGWLTHYGIGAALAICFIMLVETDWLAHPTLLPALGYGLATAVLPLFVMQPALGLGVASSRAARPVQARVKSVATHCVYGLGLYICALVAAAGIP
jgi:hypothetical protein